MRKINLYFLTLLFLFFSNPSLAFDQELRDIVETIDAAKKDFNDVDTSEVIEAVKMDKAFEQIDKVTEFVKESLEEGNEESAIKALEFIEKSLAGTNALVPQEFTSDMSKADMGSFGEDDMAVVNEITTEMKEVKEEKLNDLISGMVDISEEGLDAFGIVETLDQIGIETIDVAIAVKKKKEMATWTKEEWANSWKGDILTDDGKQIISDGEINSNISTLEQKLQTNNLEILDKKNSLSELQTKIDPLSGQITDLKTQKTDLLAKYNEEILKQSSTILSDEEINKSKELADKFNSELSDLSSQIKTAEQQSNSLQEQVQGLNLELDNEIANKTQLQSNIKDLNNQLSANQNLLSKKTLELDQLKNTDLNTKINSLNKKLQFASRERDFIQTDFEKSIDLEVDAIQRYHSALGRIDSKNFDDEVEFSIREVGVIMDADPRKYRAFELEKYATYAGFSDDYIQKGIEAINNDDWGRQRELFEEVTKKLSKNPEWVVDIPSNAELNVMIEEERAIQEAVLITNDAMKIREQVDFKIDERVNEFKSNNILSNFSKEVFEGHSERMFHKGTYSGWSVQITEEYKDLFENEVVSVLDEKTKQTFQNNLVQIERYNIAKAQGKYDTWSQASWDDYRVFSSAENQNSKILSDYGNEAKNSIISKIENIEDQINQIRNEEISKVDGYNFENKVVEVLKKIPTFEDNAELVAGYEGATLRAKLIDITSGTNSESEALYAARKAVAEIGEAPVNEYMTGSYWEMSNVKAAAIVRSKKYDWVDDYEYINAYYEEPLDLNSSQREYVEGELKGLLGQNNIKLQTLNNKISDLSNELNSTQTQSQNLTAEISKLENELSSLKNSKSEIQNQISSLSSQFSSKESLISEKTQNLVSLQEQLNPLSDKMSELKGQRADLDAKFNNQLNTIANQIESQGKATDEDNALKAQFESQIALLDTQLEDYEKQSTEINIQLASLTTELTTLEAETPDISNQISKLNQELNYVIEIKADLAMTQAIKSGINVNEKIVETVAKLENKSIIQIEGTDLMRIVDTDTLTDDAGTFEAPVGTFTSGNQVYLAGAVTREQILSVGKIDDTGDLNIQLSQIAAEKINSGMFGLETAKGLVATDDMAQGTFSMIDPKTGRQIINNHTGRGLYAGIICSGEQCGPSGDLGKKAAASGYVFVRTGDLNQGGMCSGGDCAFNISKSELETFNKQVSDGVESPFGYDDTFAAATINTKGLVLDKAIGKAAGEATKEFFSGKFNVMEEGGQEALLQKAKDAVTRLEAAKASGQRVSENMIEQARGQVAAEQSVLDAVNAAKAAAGSAEVASAATEAVSAASKVASEAAQEATQVVQAAAHEVIDGVRAQKNVVQLVQNGDGSVDIIVGRTGVNVTGSQKVVWSGLTDAAANQGTACSSGNAAGCADHKRAQAEALAASGIECTGNSCGDGY